MYPANFKETLIIDVKNPIRVVYDPSQSQDVLISSTSRPTRVYFRHTFKLKDLEIRVKTEELKKEWERRINMLIRKLN